MADLDLDSKSSKLIEQLLDDSLEYRAHEFYSQVEDPELFATVMMAIAAYEKLVVLKPEGLERIEKSYDDMAAAIEEFVENS